MTTLYIDYKETHLTIENKTLTIQYGNDKKRVPLTLLSDLIVSCDAHISCRVIRHLTAHGIRLLIIDPRQQNYANFTWFVSHHDYNRKIQQYTCFQNNQITQWLARQVIRIKLTTQIRTLRYLDQRKPSNQIYQARQTIGKQHQKLKFLPSDSDFDQLRGIEGSASQIYFQAISQWLPDHLGFQKRQKRPPTDPVNACFSLGYTLLYHQSASTLGIIGLDPSIGFYHQPVFNRLSLACDVMEPLRARLDIVVLMLFDQRCLQKNHFQITASGCYLGKTGRHLFYQTYEKHRQKFQRHLKRISHFLLRYIIQQ